MAVYSYGANNISFNTFDAWSNQFSSNSNLSLNSLMDNLEPADTAPHSVSELRNNEFLYGDVQANGTGTVSVTSGYTGQGAASSFTLRNVNFASVSSVVLTATATYPNYLEGWYSGANGTGTLLADYNEDPSAGTGDTSTGTLTLTSSTFTSVTTFYAYFVDAHA